jgi:hypothetical protein
MRMSRFAAALAVLAAAIQIPANMQAQGSQGGGRAAARRTSGLYIVQLAESPVVAYAGGVPGFAATKANRGQKIDPSNPGILGYAGYLDRRHNAIAARVGGRKVYDYRYSFNGFAAELSEAQAQALRSVQGVVAVTKDELVDADTSNTPTFLGLDAPNGLWAKLGGAGRGGKIS